MAKGKKSDRRAHTSGSKEGCGDYYGSGVRNPVAKIRDFGGVSAASMKKTKKPPKALA